MELRLGLNPLKVKTDGETKDSERTFEEEYSCDNATLTVEGNYAVADIVFQQSEGVFNIPIAITPVYEIYMQNQKFESATLSFDYETDYDEQVGIYQYLDDGSYVFVSEGTEAELEHFSRYFLGELVILDEPSRPTLDIALVIDNSGSMYSEELCPSSEENDVDFKRIDMAKALIEQSDDSTRFSFYTFTHDVTKVMDMTSDHKEMCEAIDSIKDELPYFNGTAANNAVYDAVSDFEKDNNKRHYVILLSDGYDTKSLFGFNWDTDTVVSRAADKNAVIICIGLGNDIDNPNEYKLLCYDNNDYKELKVLTIKRVKTSFLNDGATAWMSDYVYRVYDTDGMLAKAGKEINVDFDLAYGLEGE